MTDKNENDSPLSPKEKFFCEAFANPESDSFGNASRSALAAGYSQPHNAGWKLRRRPRIRAKLEEFHEAITATLGHAMTALEHTRLAALAKDPPDCATACRCAELMAKRCGGFLERVILLPGDGERLREYTLAEQAEARRIAALRLAADPTLSLPSDITRPVLDAVVIGQENDTAAVRVQARRELEAGLSDESLEGEDDAEY